MQLVIEISEDTFFDLKKKQNRTEVDNAVLNGIPFQKDFDESDCIRRSDIGLTDFEIVMCNGDYKEALKMLLDKIEKASPVTPKPFEPQAESEVEDGEK